MTTKHQKETIDQSMTDAEFFELMQAFGVGPMYVNNNGLLTKIESIPKILQEYCHNLTLHDWLDPNPAGIGHRGSATGVRYRGAILVACTAHQIWPKDQKVSLLDSVGLSFSKETGIESISPKSFSYYNKSGTEYPAESDEKDACVLNFTTRFLENPKYLRRFFNLDKNSFLQGKDKVLAYVICGYPLENIEIDFEGVEDTKSDNVIWKSNIITGYTQVLCEPVPQRPESNIGICKQVSDFNFDQNGFSGGPVFAIAYEHPHKLVIKLAGITIKFNGMQQKNQLVHFVKPEILMNLFDHSVDAFLEGDKEGNNFELRGMYLGTL